MKKSDLLRKPLEEVPFVFLDVETTGLNPQFGHRICEIGMLRYKKNRKIGSYQTLINPRRPISPGAMAVNGITDDMVLEAPTFDQIVDDVLKFINDAVIVAHNAPFDLNFFAYQFRNLGVPPLDNFVIDTLYLARAYYNFPSNSLPKVAAYMGISTQKFHRALQDSFTTKLIFDNFLRDFRRQGVNCLEDLLELQGGTVPFPQLPEIVLPPAIDEAVRGSKKLQISYVSAENVRTVRVVEPREVNAFGDNIYLVAFCHLRKEERVFRLDRIIEMKEVR